MGLDARPLFGHVPPNQTAGEQIPPSPADRSTQGHEVGHSRSQTGLSGNAIMLTVLASAIVRVPSGGRIERCQPFEPSLVVLVQPRFVVVNEHRGGDVHRVAQHQPLGDTALADNRLDF